MPTTVVTSAVHFRAINLPCQGTELGFLDDLFVDSAQHGKDLGEMLLRDIDSIMAARGWPVKNMDLRG